VPRNPYMFFRMSIIGSSTSWCSSILSMFLGRLLGAGERSEPSATADQETCGGSQRFSFNQCLLPTNIVARSFLSAFLAPARKSAGAPVEGTPAVRASSFDPRTALSQSGAQLEPRALCDPNSNRCLSGGSGRELACIRMSLNTFSACVRK